MKPLTLKQNFTAMKKNIHFTRSRFLSGLAISALAIFMILPGKGWGQQVIGEFPGQDGGFENQTTGALSTTSSTTSWWLSVASLTGNIIASGGRSSGKYANISMSGSTHRTLRGPTSATIAAGTNYTIQFYFKGDKNADGTSDYGDIRGGVSGGLYQYGAYQTNQNQTSWTKYAVTTTTNPGASTGGFAVVSIVEIAGKIADFDIDDVVIYAGAVDNAAPNTPGVVTVDGATQTTLNVGWGAASGGVDGGGYVVVRYASDPGTGNDPNQNGIYAIGNTVATGGTVRYIGTGTSFTDNVGLTANTPYWYKVYTVDKAFNYSNESTGNGTTLSSGTPIIITVASFTPFNTVTGTASGAQTYTVSGDYLTDDVTVTAPINFEVSTNGTDFYDSRVLARSGTDLSGEPVTISVRIKSTASLGSVSGDITHTSSGASQVNLAITGKVLSLEPTIQASNVIFTSVTTSGFTINWTNGDGSNRIVVMKVGSAVDGSPIDGTTYTENPAFGSGTQIGTGNYVVYAGTGSSIGITGLSGSTAYYVSIIEFNGSAGSQNYLLTSPATGNRTTLAPTLGWQISTVNTAYTIDFDNTVSGVNNGQFAGSGFTPSPSAGQLNSNSWAMTGWSNGDLAFGGTQTTSNTDYTRSTSTGGVTTGGVYAFTVSSGNNTFRIPAWFR